MDDIITRWASDLSKYQKEFQKQADKVAAWDRMLVENSEKIQKLYGSTLEAERATTEVERQLSAVESDQETLETWLNFYEKEVDSMIASQQGGQGETISAPDQERERTYVEHLLFVTSMLMVSRSYQIASKLSERLDEMGNDLTTMIEEINDASSTLSKTGKADDPVSLLSVFVFQLIVANLASCYSSPKSSVFSTAILPNCSRLIKVPRPSN